MPRTHIRPVVADAVYGVELSSSRGTMWGHYTLSNWCVMLREGIVHALQSNLKSCHSLLSTAFCMESETAFANLQ